MKKVLKMRHLLVLLNFYNFYKKITTTRTTTRTRTTFKLLVRDARSEKGSFFPQEKYNNMYCT